MRELGYPGVYEHSLIHADLLMQLDMMTARIAHHKDEPEDLLYFLNKCCTPHR